jgi:hypothetical protein
MDSLEIKLIELNEALYNLSVEKKAPNPELLENAKRIISGGSIINTGAGNDTVIINKQGGGDCQVGPAGEQGPPGPPGPAGECSCNCSTILISEDYIANSNDCYIGVNSNSDVTILLPENPSDGTIIIVKAEMGPPLGNRKVTVETFDTSIIDGNGSYVMTIPYESVTLLYRGGDWWKI